MKGAHQSNLEHTEALGDLSRNKDDLELRLNEEVWVSVSTSVLGPEQLLNSYKQSKN